MTGTTTTRTASGTASRTRARAVFTGIGVAAPGALGTEEWWAATLRGESGIGPVTDFDASGHGGVLVGRVPGFEPEKLLPGRLLPQTDRVTRLALVAAQEALADAGADPADLPEYAMSAVTSNATGGFEFTHREIRKLWTEGPKRVSVYESFAWFYAVNTGQISIRHGMRGAGGVLVSDQAGGLDALGHARRTLRKGGSLAVAGALESALDPWGLAAHLSSGDHSRSSDPRTAFLPFDSRASGAVPGEGGALFILEDAAHAGERGARQVYGELAGYAATFDPPPGSPRPPGLERAARLALADAGAGPEDIDVVFPDAAGTPARDDAEATALRNLFGPYGVPVSVPKTLTGRLSSGSPALDVAAALLAVRDGVVPPAANLDRPVPGHRLDLVRDLPRELRVRTALVLARGHGGFNAAVVLRAPRD
ncbi:ketosynthase chain-length factor [Streptomyces sp. NPDC058653]|uniref:ketosynthase chain-length factor n=1 Tax=Streptomyces sp. NPDC058653 TaxID=3346576 RepID=UPI0036555E4E